MSVRIAEPRLIAVHSPRAKRSRKLMVLVGVALGVLALIAVLKFRGRHHDPRENAAPAPKWNGAAATEKPDVNAQPVKLRETVEHRDNVNHSNVDDSELKIDFQIPTSQNTRRWPLETENAPLPVVAGVARLTGDIQPEAVAERPNRPWVR